MYPGLEWTNHICGMVYVVMGGVVRCGVGWCGPCGVAKKLGTFTNHLEKLWEKLNYYVNNQ